MIKSHRQFTLLRVLIWGLVCLFSFGSVDAVAGSRKKNNRGNNGPSGSRSVTPPVSGTTPLIPPGLFGNISSASSESESHESNHGGLLGPDGEPFSGGLVGAGGASITLFSPTPNAASKVNVDKEVILPLPALAKTPAVQNSAVNEGKTVSNPTRQFSTSTSEPVRPTAPVKPVGPVQTLAPKTVSSNHQPAKPVAQAPVVPEVPIGPPEPVQLNFSTDLEEEGWGKEIIVGLPGPIRAFVVALLHVSRIPRTFPDDFSATWVASEKARPNPHDRIKQASNLKALLHAILKTYDKPRTYEGEPIQDYAQYLKLVAPLEGDTENSFRQELEHMASRLKEAVLPAIKVPIPNIEQGLGHFGSRDVQRQARERETINRLFTKSMTMALVTRGADRGAATYVFEILMRSFASALFANAGEPLAATLDEGLNILEGKVFAQAMPDKVQMELPANPYLRAGRLLSHGIRKASDYDGFQEAFFCFLRRFAAMDEESLMTVIEAFESALGQIVALFAEEAERLIHVNDAFSNQGNRANQAAAISVFIERYPHLIPQVVLKDIILELLVLPIRPRVGNDSEILGVIIKYADPITQSLVQRGGPQSAGFIEQIREKVQSSNRRIPPTTLKKIILADPNKLVSPDFRFAPISLDDMPERVEKSNEPFDEVDPRALGAGKFFVIHKARRSRTGEVRVLKVMKPDSSASLDYGIQIASFLAPELSQVIFKPKPGTDSRRLTAQLEREIDSLSLELRGELDLERTVRNQKQAYQVFNGKTLSVNSEEGPVQFVFRVPEIGEVPSKSSMMEMEVVRGIIPTREFIKRHRGAAPLAAKVLFDQFFEALVFVPREQHRKSLEEVAAAKKILAAKKAELQEGEPANPPEAEAVGLPTILKPEGFGTLDGHTGNNLFTYQGVGANNIRTYEIWFIDWGLATRLQIDSDIESLLALGFGCSLNDPKVIGNLLWELSNVGRVAAGKGLSPEYSKQLAQKKREVLSYVKSKAFALWRNRQFWGPSDWIFNLWRHGLLDFPPNLARLQEGIAAQRETMKTLTRDTEIEFSETLDDLDKPENRSLILDLEERGKWPAVQAAQARLGVISTWFKISKFVVGSRLQSCAWTLANAVAPRQRKYIDPND